MMKPSLKLVKLFNTNFMHTTEKPYTKQSRWLLIVSVVIITANY